MTFVVGDNCIRCKHTDCVEVCPVDCFYEGPNFLVIHPDECIDCALCEPECPVDAIYAEDELPENQQEFLGLNAELAEIWTNITEKKDPLQMLNNGQTHQINYLIWNGDPNTKDGCSVNTQQPFLSALLCFSVMSFCFALTQNIFCRNLPTP